MSDYGNNETGSYSLNLEKLNGPCRTPTPISCGQILSGAIDVILDKDPYTLTVNAGDVMSMQTAGLFTRMELYDSMGSQISSINGNTPLNYTFATGGAYTLWVSDYGNNETGSYSLNLEKLNGPCRTPTPISCGQILSGAIDVILDKDPPYTLTVNAGDVMSMQTAGLFTRMELYDSMGSRYPLSMAILLLTIPSPRAAPIPFG